MMVNCIHNCSSCTCQMRLLMQLMPHVVCRWITGHTYLTYAPLLLGATSVIFEGVPVHPDAGRVWQIVAKYKVGLTNSSRTASLHDNRSRTVSLLDL